MSTNFDFQKPIEAAQALFATQIETINKSVELQKKAGEEMLKFFQGEAEKAKKLKTPEDVVKFNIDSNTALFNLMKAQGEAFTALANEASQNALAQLKKLNTPGK